MTKDEMREHIKQHLHDDGAAIETLWPEIVVFVEGWLWDAVENKSEADDLMRRWRNEMHPEWREWDEVTQGVKSG
jgi:hypothetical protein